MSDAPDDEEFDSDHGVVEAMMAPYEGLRFDAVPPDPRRIDVAVLRALRERLASPYSYRWRASRANLEIALALYEGRESRRGDLIRLTHAFHLADADGIGPPFTRSPISWGPKEGYHRRYYITVAISSVRDYIGELGDAEALLRSVLPGWGYAMRYGAGGDHALHLERGAEHGAWSDGIEPPARALVIALLERLEAHPDEAPPWREP